MSRANLEPGGNCVAATRAKRGLGQRVVANRVDISLLRLACIEAGVTPCPIPVAVRLSEVLDTEMHSLFPAAVRALAGRSYDELTDAELDKIDALGIDADLREWSVKGVLSGGEEFLWKVGSRDQRRMFRAIQREDDDRYFVFDADDLRIVFNLDHVLSCQFLYEPPVANVLVITDPKDCDEWMLNVTFASAHIQPLRFEMEPDTPDREDLFQTADIFKLAETGDGPEPFIARLTDRDGEHAFIRMESVAMLTVPIDIVEPTVLVEREGVED